MDWNFPYASKRMPLLAANCVATTQPLAAQAGLSMLARGGGAVDAAVAAAITLTVVEPVMNGIGSDAFAIVAEGGRLHGLNASGRAPRAWNAGRFAGRDAMPALGWDSVTVPGAVSAWAALHGKFGRLPFAALFEPAIRYARDGFLVTPVIARSWSDQAATLGSFEGFARTFLPGGRAPTAGELFRCPDQAATLKLIAATEGEAFYRGGLAERIVAAAKAEGGAMVLDDLGAAQGGLGRAARDRLQGLSHPRAAAERPGDRGADRARHSRPHRPRRTRSRRRRNAAPANRGDQTRHGRRPRACRRSRDDARPRRRAADARLISTSAPNRSIGTGRSRRIPASPGRTAPSISPRRTPAGRWFR